MLTLALRYSSATKMSTSSIFKSFVLATTFISSTSFAQFLGNWDLDFLSLDTDFSASSTDEFVLHYRIGKDRVFAADLYDKGCSIAVDIPITTTPVRTSKDDDHDTLDIHLDLDKSAITSSNIWTAFSRKLEICVRLRLISATGTTVIKEHFQEISTSFDFAVDFDVDSALVSASMSQGISSQVDSAQVETYVEACKCDGTNFVCNDTPVASSSEEMWLCVRSLSSDMNIDSMSTLQLNQLGNEPFIYIDGNTVQDESISRRFVVPEKNGVAVTMLVPSAYWSYSGSASITLSGSVWLMFSGGSRRKLNIPLNTSPRVLRKDSFADAATASNEQSSFHVDVALKQSEILETKLLVNTAAGIFTSTNWMLVAMALAHML